jgi:hypothetical protein
VPGPIALGANDPAGPLACPTGGGAARGRSRRPTGPVEDVDGGVGVDAPCAFLLDEQGVRAATTPT